MNRFHLLSIEEEEGSKMAMATQATYSGSGSMMQESAKASPSKAKATSKREYDRRSRGMRKGEGEKHQTVGRGSWGRPIEGMLEVAEGEEEDEAAPKSGGVKEGEHNETVPDSETNKDENKKQESTTEQEKSSSTKVEKPPLVLKTVKEYLAEQAERQQRLQMRTKPFAIRRANEGNEMGEEEQQVLQVIKKQDYDHPHHSTNSRHQQRQEDKKSTMSKESKAVKMTLQELNGALPASGTGKTSFRSSTTRSNNSSHLGNDERRPRNRPDGPARSYERGMRSDGPARSYERGMRSDGPLRRQGGDSNNRENPYKSATINLKDSNAFPALV